MKFDCIVVGGGPAGMICAITAAEMGCQVLLLDKNDRLGKKLLITGKGRCNVTNDCTAQEVLQNTPRNGRFLFSAMSAFPPERIKAFFEENGCQLKTERGNRVFPVSDKAADIVAAMEKKCVSLGIRTVFRRVKSVLIEDGIARGVETAGGVELFDRVIVCTGGKSYPKTGSDGDGYRFAREAGHSVTPLSPSLVPLIADGKLCASMQGLSLKNVSLRMIQNATGKCIYEDFGEMLFTHFGITGPLVLSASAHLSDISAGRLCTPEKI